MKHHYFIITLFIYLISPLQANANIILMGTPGSGKGTFSNFILNRYNFHQINPGNLLRNEVNKGSDLGEHIKDQVRQGELVDNAIVWMLVHSEIQNALEKRRSFILDAFPSSLENLESLLNFINQRPDLNFLFILLNAPEEVCIDRIAGRLICPICGKIYNDATSPPLIHGQCDFCNISLYKRHDDNFECASKRVFKSAKQLSTIIDSLNKKGFKVITYDTNCSIEEIYKKYEGLIDEYKPYFISGRDF